MAWPGTMLRPPSPGQVFVGTAGAAEGDRQAAADALNGQEGPPSDDLIQHAAVTQEPAALAERQIVVELIHELQFLIAAGERLGQPPVVVVVPLPAPPTRFLLYVNMKLAEKPELKRCCIAVDHRMVGAVARIGSVVDGSELRIGQVRLGVGEDRVEQRGVRGTVDGPRERIDIGGPGQVNRRRPLVGHLGQVVRLELPLEASGPRHRVWIPQVGIDNEVLREL